VSEGDGPRFLDPSGLEAVLLDAGGTLITLDHAWLVRELAARGVTTDETALLASEAAARAWADAGVRRGRKPRDLWAGYFGRMLARVGLPEEEGAPFVEMLWRRNREDGLWRTPVPGAHEVLAELQGRGYRLAVVSNAEGQVEKDLRAAGFGPYLELVVDSHRVGVEKPDPGIFRLALERLSLEPAAAVYVGDVYAIDVVGARAAGLQACLVDPAGAYPGADCPRLGGLEELLGLLPGSPDDS
jgi:putative hydrolase of the HAD superfamily